MKPINFDKVCHAETLEDEIIAAGFQKGATFKGITSDPDGDPKNPRVTVFLDDAATADDLAQIQSLVAAHDLLPAAQAVRIEELRSSCSGYIFGHYDAGTQASLNALFTEGQSQGYTNRVARIRLVVSWVGTCLDYYYSVKDAIGKAADPASVSWDFGQFDATIPDVSLRDVRKLDN